MPTILKIVSKIVYLALLLWLFIYMFDAYSKAFDNIKDPCIFYGYFKDYKECDTSKRGGSGDPSSSYKFYRFCGKV